MVMEKLFKLLADKKASDLFLSPGSAAHIKINGTSIPINQQKLDPPSVTALMREILTERQWQEFEDRRELNVGYSLQGVGSFRINVFQQRGSPACVVRYIPGDVPQFDKLGLPETLRSLVMEKLGLVLVVGSTGSGKSTTLASMIDYRNEQRSGHILTFEDPIEFAFRNKRRLINLDDTDTGRLQIRHFITQRQRNLFGDGFATDVFTRE